MKWSAPGRRAIWWHLQTAFFPDALIWHVGFNSFASSTITPRAAFFFTSFWLFYLFLIILRAINTICLSLREAQRSTVFWSWICFVSPTFTDAVGYPERSCRADVTQDVEQSTDNTVCSFRRSLDAPSPKTKKKNSSVQLVTKDCYPSSILHNDGSPIISTGSR